MCFKVKYLLSIQQHPIARMYVPHGVAATWKGGVVDGELFGFFCEFEGRFPLSWWL
jgi:hypothetical protein